MLPPTTATALLRAIFLSTAVAAAKIHINTTSAMRDGAGQPIYDCLEPHIFHFEGVYYAYGFTSRESEIFATTCYSSTDLKAWTRRAYFPTNATLDGDNPQNAMALWYVVYNDKNQEFVGYGAHYGVAINVYTSKHPVGPFIFKSRMSAVYGGLGDMLIYKDDSDRQAYLIYNSFEWPSGRFTHVYRLNSDYTDIIPSSLASNTTRYRMEGFWMLKRESTYYLFGSPLAGCDVADNFYFTAPSPLGPYTYEGLFAPKGSKTFHSQTFQGLTVSSASGQEHVFIGHRWGALAPPFLNATSIWLPLRFGSNGKVLEMKWFDSWDLEVGASTEEFV